MFRHHSNRQVAEGTRRFCELVLRDRNRLSSENALAICNYIMAMKMEVNPRLNTIRTAIQFLSELSKTVGIEKRFFEDMATTRDYVLLYLDKVESRRTTILCTSG